MELNEYQKKALTTALYDEKHKIIYPAIGLGGEAGEVLNKVKKWLRGDDESAEEKAERRESIKGELGDVLWYVAVLARDLDLNLEEIAQGNVEKLKTRLSEGKIKGDGDKR